MKEGKTFKFRGDTFRIIKIILGTILAINVDEPFQSIRRFPDFKIVE